MSFPKKYKSWSPLNPKNGFEKMCLGPLSSQPINYLCKL